MTDPSGPKLLVRTIVHSMANTPEQDRSRDATRDATAGNSSGAVRAKADQINHVAFGAKSGFSRDVLGCISHRLLQLR